MTIKVNAGLMRIASSAVSSEYTRYYLQGVFIEPHHERGAMMVSTDGHRMVVVHDPDAICDQPALVRFTKAMRRKSYQRSRELPRYVTVDVAAKTASISEEGTGGHKARGLRLTAHDVIVDGTFPEWKKVVPSVPDDGRVLGSFNPKYLRKFGELGRDIWKTLDIPTGAPMRMWQKDVGAPTVIRWDKAPNVFALLMPMKWEGSDAALPDFFKGPEPEKQAA